MEALCTEFYSSSSHGFYPQDSSFGLVNPRLGYSRLQGQGQGQGQYLGQDPGQGQDQGRGQDQGQGGRGTGRELV